MAHKRVSHRARTRRKMSRLELVRMGAGAQAEAGPVRVTVYADPVAEMNRRLYGEVADAVSEGVPLAGTRAGTVGA